MPLLPDALAVPGAINGNPRETRRGGEAGRATDRFAGESDAG